MTTTYICSNAIDDAIWHIGSVREARGDVTGKLMGTFLVTLCNGRQLGGAHGYSTRAQAPTDQRPGDRLCDRCATKHLARRADAADKAIADAKMVLRPRDRDPAVPPRIAPVSADQAVGDLRWIDNLTEVGEPIRRKLRELEQRALRAAHLRTEADELDAETRQLAASLEADVTTSWTAAEIAAAKEGTT